MDPRWSVVSGRGFCVPGTGVSLTGVESWGLQGLRLSSTVSGGTQGHAAVKPSFCSDSRSSPSSIIKDSKVTVSGSSSSLSSFALDYADVAEFWVQAHRLVVASGLPNYQFCRLPVRSGLNISYWRDCFSRSEGLDSEVLDLLEFGFPLGFSSVSVPEGGLKNHSGAETFDQETIRYLEKELMAGAVIGPFVDNPLVTHLVVSPINSIPKRNSVGRRFVSDLSFPHGNSVNDGIELDTYLGSSVRVSYPSVDSFVELIKKFGVGSLLFKKDLSRAYRQFYLDPADIRFQGFKWRGEFFVDCSLVMGCKSAAMMCQRATSAVTMFLEAEGVYTVAYLDDFAGCADVESAGRAFRVLGQMLKDLGLEESEKKSLAPASRMEFLGITFDTVSMTLEVTPARLLEIKALLLVWLDKKSATKKELQSLIGKLQFTARCVPAGRLFISRLLDHLRGLKASTHRKRLGAEFRKDLLWWTQFVDVFNGVSIMLSQEWLKPDSVFATDACLTGGGGWVQGEYFKVQFPSFIVEQSWHINSLELLVLLVALKLWSYRLRGLKVRVYCDNESTVSVLNSGRCRDTVMLSLLREVVFVCAESSCMVRAVHVSGVNNRLADSLSRYGSLSVADRASLEDSLEGWVERLVSDDLFVCKGTW